MVVQRDETSSSPVTITVSSGGDYQSSSMSLGITSPVPRNPHSPINVTTTNPHRRSSLSNSKPPRYLTSSKGDSKDGSSEFVQYTVQIPLTPDHNPSSPAEKNEPRRSIISGTIFSGGLNCVTKKHAFLDHHTSEVAKSSGMVCRIGGCDAVAFLANSKPPCECGFLICKECYKDCVGTGGCCPGCKDPYTVLSDDEFEKDDDDRTIDEEEDLPLTSMAEFKPNNRRFSIMKSMKQPDFDHTRWLFETKGTYGYGNAVWPKGGNGCCNQGINVYDDPPNFGENTRKPLTRKVAISAAILSPYRYVTGSLSSECITLFFRR